MDYKYLEAHVKAPAHCSDTFTRDQAASIKQIVEELPPDVATIIVHCEDGFSRSCAIAVALNKLYWYDAIQEQLADLREKMRSGLSL